MNISLKAHKLIGCQGVTRSDFKFYEGKFYLLEINTQPGMTSLSLVPEIAAYHGINFIELIKLILKNALQKSKKILIYFFLFLLIGTFNNKNINNFNDLKINSIYVSGLSEKKILKYKKVLNF